MTEKLAGTLAVGILLIACAGPALAQQAPRPGGGQRPERARAMPLPRRGGLYALLSDRESEVEVNDVDDGVELKIATRSHLVELLQARAEVAVLELRIAADRRAARMPLGRAEGPDGAMVLLLTGGAEIAIQRPETGVVLRFTSDEPAGVEVLQRDVARWVDQVREGDRQGRDRMEDGGGAREVLRLLGSGDVEVSAAQTDKGVAVTVSSNDPETIARIKEDMPGAIEALQELARRMQERERLRMRPGQRGEETLQRRRRRREDAPDGARAQRFGAPLPPGDTGT